jgi:WD40 repeat protein/tRNA A-37 threonylcarbamoyl transferase component Bud32
VRGYEILSVVGLGGMGIVYEARHIELNRRVALKMLRGEALADPEYRERFRAEAEAIARLQHPNIIQVFEVGTVVAEDDETPSPFLALEFVDGGSLAQHTYAPQPPRAAAQMVETLARAAHAAHRLGVVHRDLKPANVLLTRDGVPKIADFGIAKRIDAERTSSDRLLTRAGTVMGTPEYMAPEHLKGNPATPVIDVYALGVILYELLTARVPIQGATFADTMLLSMRQEPVPPRRLQPGVPRDLETICLKCLEKNPAKRYESAEALADDLARWATGRTIRARPVGAAGRTVRWALRNPTVSALSVAVLLVALTGVTGIVWQWNGARTNAAVAQDNARKAEAAATGARDAAGKERWERYRAGVFAASSALRLHDTNAARRSLDDSPVEHRDWVWHLLRAQLDRSNEVFLSDRGERQTGRARFTPDGRWAVLRDVGGAFRVWHLPTHQEFHPLAPQLQALDAILSTDGTTLVYRNHTRDITVCDPFTGATRAVLRGHTDEIDSIAFTPDETRVVSTSTDRTARIWDVRTGKQLRLFQAPLSTTRPLVVSPDLRLVASRGEGALTPRVWELETGREIARLEGHQERVYALRFSPQGDRLITYEQYPSNTIRLWDPTTGRLLATMRGHENQIYHLAFSPDGTKIVSGSMDRTVRVWDLSRGPGDGRDVRPLHVLKGHTGWIEQVSFSPDGKRIVSCAYDSTLRYWNAETGELLAVLQGHTARVLAAAYRADGTVICSASFDGTVRTWDVNELESNYAIHGHTNFVYGVSFHPDGLRIASCAWDGTARVWDVTRRRELLVLPHTTADPDSKIVTAVAYHPGGRYLATIARDDSVRLWDGETGALLHRWQNATRSWRDTRLAFRPDGTLLAAGDSEGHIRIWDVSARTEYAVLSGHTTGIRDVAFSPDGTWLASVGETGDQTVRIWNVAAKSEVRVLRGHTGGVYAVAWHPRDPLLASGCYDGTVRLWDPTTGTEVGLLKQGTNIYALAFTRDGKFLAVACADNLIRIWDLATRQELAALSGHSDYVHALAFSPDGSRLVSASGDRTIRVWDTLLTSQRNNR